MQFLSVPRARSVVAAFVFLAIFTANFQTGRSAVPGSLVPDFGDGAPVISDIGGSDTASAIVARTDGRFYVVGSMNQGSTAAQDFYLARFGPNGTLETFVTTDFDGRVDTAVAAALQTDGKVVVLGRGFTPSGASDPRVLVARYLPNGGLDTSFDTDGKLVLPAGNAPAGSAVAIQVDGKIVIAGDYGSTPRMFVQRLNPDGSNDTTFNSGNAVTVPSTELVSTSEISIRPDGRIMVSARIDSTFTLVRLNSSGTLDTSFDGDGIVQTDFFGNSEDPSAGIALMPDGRIVAGGSAFNNGNRFAVARYMGNGTLDTTFDADGKATIDFPGGSEAVRDMILQPDGRVLMVGSVNSVGAVSVRFNENGIVDGTYAAAGLSFRPSDTVSAHNACVLYGDSILTAGSVGTGTAANTYVTKIALTPDAPSSADFDGDGTADLSTFRASNGGWYVLNSRTNTFTASFFGTTGDIPADADLDGDRRNDLVVFRPSTGTWHTQKSSTGVYTPVNWGANGDKAVAADYDKDGRTDIAVWRPSSGIYYVLRSSDSQFFITQWGASGDIPIGGSPQ